jgi:hypothetical protein
MGNNLRFWDDSDNRPCNNSSWTVGLGSAKISVADDPSYDTSVSPSLLDLSGYFVNIVFIGPFIFSVRNGT